MYKASVKIMRSFDYNHFEVCLSTDEELTLEQVDDMRKEAARLVDKAVEQYRTKKLAVQFEPERELQQQVKAIRENFPKSEWTPEQKAKVKLYEDRLYWSQYDYQDQWEMDHD